jgi:hypothetical protein
VTYGSGRVKDKVVEPVDSGIDGGPVKVKDGVVVEDMVNVGCPARWVEAR